LREHKWEGHREREFHTDLALSAGPDVGLDPRTLGSWPVLKADA